MIDIHSVPSDYFCIIPLNHLPVVMLLLQLIPSQMKASLQNLFVWIIVLAYELPNVFTPNGDGDNDYWKPTSHSFVEKVDMKVYSRWGILVFQTDDPDINWDGKQNNSDNIVSPGVYYYIADVYENRLTGLEVRNIVGFVYVFTERGAKNPAIDQ